MKNFDILGFHWKIGLLGEGVNKKPILGELPKKVGRGGGLGQFGNLRIGVGGGGGGVWPERGGGVFGGGLIPPMHTMEKV